MFRNWVSAALGNLKRSPVQSLISIGGLAIGIAVVILAGIVTQSQFSHDHFVPGYERLYFAVIETKDQDGDHFSLDTPYDLAGYFREGYPGMSGVARIANSVGVFSNGNIQAKESFEWADPNLFRLMRLPVLYGNLNGALARPDNIVIPLQTARKYFGRDDVVGQVLELDHAHPFVIAAVISDLPPNASSLQSGIIAAGLSPFSIMSQDVGHIGFGYDGGMMINVRTLVQLAPGGSLGAMTVRASALVSRFVPRNQPYRRAMVFDRVDRLAVSPHFDPDSRLHLALPIAVALTILSLAGVNFVNLAVARSLQRAREVAMRKTAGAGRSVLIAQFLGESIMQALFALCLAIALLLRTLAWRLQAKTLSTARM